MTLFRRRPRPEALERMIAVAGERRVLVLDGASVDDAADTVGVIRQLAALTGGALTFDAVDCVEHPSGRRRLSLRRGERRWGDLLAGRTDGIDGESLLPALNAALAALGAPGRLVAFDPGYRGQEDAFAYLSQEMAERVAPLLTEPRTPDGDAMPGVATLWTGGPPPPLPLHGHSASASEVSGVALSPDGRRVASAGGDGMVRTWDLLADAELEPSAVAGAEGVAFDAAGALLVGTAAGVRRGDRTLGARRVTTLAVDGSRTRMVVGALARDAAWIEVWDLRHEVQIAEWSLDDGNVRVAISADGRSIAAVSETGAVGLWTAEGERRHDDRADGCVWGVALSGDGSRLAVGAESGRIAVLDAATRRVLREHQARCGVWTLALAPDGETLAVGGGLGVELMPATGAALELPGPTNGVGCVAWLPDGRLLAGACDRGGVGWVYLWAEPLLPLRG